MSLPGRAPLCFFLIFAGPRLSGRLDSIFTGLRLLGDDHAAGPQRAALELIALPDFPEDGLGRMVFGRLLHQRRVQLRIEGPALGLDALEPELPQRLQCLLVHKLHARQERVIVGVNRYADSAPLDIPILDMDPQGYEHQKRRLADLRRSRDGEAMRRALNALEDAARHGRNTMPLLIEAVKADATLGEIMDVLRQVMGIYEEPVVI